MPRLIQNVLKPLIEYKKFKGIDNLVTDDMRVPTGFVRVANNVDIDSEEMMHMREGILQELISGNFHSLWSNENDLCFAVKNDDLIQITDVYKSESIWMVTYSNVLVGVGSSRMNFVPVGRKTFFSNLFINGYIEDGVAYAFPEIDNTELENAFKERMVGGDLIEYFNSRLYSVQGEVIYHSDAGNPMIMDTRNNFFIFGGGVTMMLAVKDGLYISHGSKVVWLNYQGETKLNTPDFGYKLLLNVPAIKGSAVPIERMVLGQAGVVGRCVLFSTQMGIFMGLPGGYVKDCTSDHYAVYDIEEGTSFVKQYDQYVFLGQMPAGMGGAGIEIIDPNSTIQIYS